MILVISDAKRVELTTALGEEVKRLREKQKISKRELSVRSGVARSMIRSVENGIRTPTVDTLARIAEGLDEKPDKILASARKRIGL